MKHTTFLKKIYIILAAALVAIIAVYFLFFQGNAPARKTVTVARGTIMQEVTVTGKTKPQRDIELAFEKSGIVRQVYAAVGTKVKASQALAALDQGELSAQLLQAEASVEAARAKLKELQRGARQEDIEVSRTAVQKAAQDLDNKYLGVADMLNETFAKAEDAVRKQADPLYTDDETDPNLSFSVKSFQTDVDAINSRAMASGELNLWKKELEELGASKAALNEALEKGLVHLAKIRTFLDVTMQAIQDSTNLDAAAVLNYRAYIATARTNVNSSIASINGKKKEIASANISVKQAENELNLKLAGNDPHQITAQEAAVKEAEANAANIRVQLSKTVLRSPLQGIVTRQDAKIGQVAPANTALIAIISEGKLEIEANIPEVDIAKVAPSNSARVTLDAYGESVPFDAVVVSIDPAETVIEGVATYKTKFAFLKDDLRVRPGMTANIEILAERREGVLIVPQRAVGTRNGTRLVWVFANGKLEEREITTGLRGSDGNIEIISGLAEREEIAAAPPKE